MEIQDHSGLYGMLSLVIQNLYILVLEECNASKVAQGFADSISNNFYDSASNDKLKKGFFSAYEQYAGNRPNDCTLFTLADIKLAISNLKMGIFPGLE